jgi:phosphoribosylformylglycinamidine (FGAM) synthase-like amidotransferase family enzyme
MALGPNDGGTFICEWVEIEPIRASRCIWTADLDASIACPIAHGEGRFTCDDDAWDALVANDRIALRYAGRNPNGSRGAVAGICDASGYVLGLMPHPENHVIDRQHPGFHRFRHNSPLFLGEGQGVSLPSPLRGGARGEGWASSGHRGLRLFEEGVRHARA